MTSQEQLAKIGQVALDAKAEGLGLPARLMTTIRVVEQEELSLPEDPGMYLLRLPGTPDRTALLAGGGTWFMDGLPNSSHAKTPAEFRSLLVSTGRRAQRIYTAVEAQKLAADAVDLADELQLKDARRMARRMGQDDVIRYINSIHQPSYSKLLGELNVATAPGGTLYAGGAE